MNFLELTKERYSVREYSDKQVEKEKLDKILEAGNNAPTAGNFQPQRIYVIQSREAREKIKKVSRVRYSAPCFLLVCYNEDESWFGQNNGFGAIDAAIVGTHMVLEATEQGLGSMWVSDFHPGMAREEFNLPDNIIPVALILMGYPSEEAKPNYKHSIRKSISETVKYL